MVKVIVAYTHGIPYKKEIQSAMLSKSLLNRCLYGDVIVDNSLRNATSPRKRYSQTETQQHSIAAHNWIPIKGVVRCSTSAVHTCFRTTATSRFRSPGTRNCLS